MSQINPVDFAWGRATLKGVDTRLFLLLALTCGVAGLIDVRIAGAPFAPMGFLVANAITLAVMVRQPPVLWPLSATAMVTGTLIASALLGRPVVSSLGLCAAGLVQVLIGAALIRKWLRGPAFPEMGLAHHLRVQFIAAGVAPVAGGYIAAITLGALVGADESAVWWSWLSGSIIATLAIAPVILTASRAYVAGAVRGRAGIEAVSIALASMAVMGVSVAFVRYPYVLFSLPLAAAALRTNPFVTSVVSLLSVSVVAVLGAHGLLAIQDGVQGTAGAPVGLFLALAILLPFAISILVAEQRREQARIAESEERFRSAMENAAIGMALVAADGAFIRANRSLCDMLGYSEEELLVMNFQQITHPDDLGADLDLVKRTWAGEIDTYRMEKRYIRKDGSLLWALLAVSIVRDKGTQKPLYFVSQIEDITARKNAEAALEESESRWNFALDSARQGVWDFDVRTGRSFYSPLWGQMLGYGPDELGTDPGLWLSLIHPDDLDQVEQMDRDHLEGKIAHFECEFRMRHKDGHWIWILDRGKVIARDSQGQPLRMVGTHTDITSLRESERRIARLSQRIQLAAKAGGVGLWEYNPATGELWWDERMRELYGVSPENGVDAFRQWKERLHPEDRERIEFEGRKAVDGIEPYDVEFRIVLPSGEIRHVRALADAIPNTDGAGLLLIGTNWDITEHRRLTDAVVEEKERLRTTLQSLGDAVISTDTESRITLMNTAAEELTGWPANEAIGQTLSSVVRIIDESTGAFIGNPVEDCLTGETSRTAGDHAVLVSRKGRRDIRSTAAPVRSGSGEIAGAVLVFQDVTEARRLQRQLTHSATHDSLTGLANRTAFEAALRDACITASEEDRHHALCFVDLDRFKIVNDTAGHAAGDALLREIGQVIRQNVRSNDMTARLGGDEFGLILYDCDVERAELVARKIIESVQAIPFAWEGRTYDVGASIGLTIISQAGAVPSELLSQADIACYAAKGHGRNRAVVYRSGESDARRLHRDIKVAASIRGAIEKDRFRLLGQEIRRLAPGNGNVRHFEVLLRMVEDDGTLLEPQLFIPAAERYDLMAKIDRWVFRSVLREYGDQSFGGADFTVSVNLSANSLSDPTFWPFLEAEFANSRLSPHRLRLEITETALINNIAASSLLVESAQRAGCAIMLDDFGTGLSSFAYLKRFPIQYLKIDGSFMKNLKRNTVDRAIVESINEIAHKLGAETIAEWVEDGETADVLRGIGVDYAQGYAIARPVFLDTILTPIPTERPALRRIG
jgi:diguanylate cyclase (GGDEF)-like protein/PAS domain S-box-containing protein